MTGHVMADLIRAALDRMDATLTAVAAAQYATTVGDKIQTPKTATGTTTTATATTTAAPAAASTEVETQIESQTETQTETQTVTVAAHEFARMQERIAALSSEAAHWRSEHSGLVRRFATATLACRAIEREAAKTAQHHIRHVHHLHRELHDSRARCCHLQRRFEDSALERQELLDTIEHKRGLVDTAVDCAATLEVRRVELEGENERLAATIRRMEHEHAAALETQKREYRRVCEQLNDLCTSWAHYAEFVAHEATASRESTTAVAVTVTATATATADSASACVVYRACVSDTKTAAAAKPEAKMTLTQPAAAQKKSAPSSRLRLPTPVSRRFLRKPSSTTESSSSSIDSTDSSSDEALSKTSSRRGPRSSIGRLALVSCVYPFIY